MYVSLYTVHVLHVKKIANFCVFPFSSLQRKIPKTCLQMRQWEQIFPSSLSQLLKKDTMPFVRKVRLKKKILYWQSFLDDVI